MSINIHINFPTRLKAVITPISALKQIVSSYKKEHPRRYMRMDDQTTDDVMLLFLCSWHGIYQSVVHFYFSAVWTNVFKLNAQLLWLTSLPCCTSSRLRADGWFIMSILMYYTAILQNISHCFHWYRVRSTVQKQFTQKNDKILHHLLKLTSFPIKMHPGWLIYVEYKKRNVNALFHRTSIHCDHSCQA